MSATTRISRRASSVTAFFMAVVILFATPVPAYSAAAPDASTGTTASGSSTPTAPATPAAPAAGTTGTATGTAAAPDSPPTASEDDGGWTSDLIGNVLGGLLDLVMKSSVEALRDVLTRVTTSTTPVVNGNVGDGDWFAIQYQMMMNVGWWVMLPLIFAMIIHSILKGSMQLLLRSICLYLPLAVLGTIVATQMIQMLIAIVDDMCMVFVNMTADDLGNFERGFDILGGHGGGFTTVISYLLGIFLSLSLMVGSLVLWIVFVLRDASVYLAVMFMPVGFAMMVWPMAARYFRKMVEFLVGVILSKLVMLVIISLAVAAFAGMTGTQTAGNAALFPTGNALATQNGPTPVVDTASQGGAVDTGGEDPNFMQRVVLMLAAVVMVFLAALSPPMTVKLIGNMGLGEMAAQMADTLNTQSWLYQYIGMERQTRIWFNNPREMLRSRFGHKDTGQEGSRKQKERLRNTSYEDESLKGQGWGRDPVSGTYQATEKDLRKAKIELGSEQADFILDLTGSEDANKIALGKTLLEMDPEDRPDLEHQRALAAQLDGYHGAGMTSGLMIQRKDGTALYLQDIVSRDTKKPQRWVDPHLVKHELDAEAKRQKAATGQVRGIDIKSNVRFTYDKYGRQVGVNRRNEKMAQVLNRAARQGNSRHGTKAIKFDQGSLPTIADRTKSDVHASVASNARTTQIQHQTKRQTRQARREARRDTSRRPPGVTTPRRPGGRP